MYGCMFSSILEKMYKSASTPMLAALILQLFGFCDRALVCHHDQNPRDRSLQRSLLRLAVSGGQEAHSHGNQSAGTDQERRQGKVCLEAVSFFFLCSGVIDKVDSAMSKMQALVFLFFQSGLLTCRPVRWNTSFVQQLCVCYPDASDIFGLVPVQCLHLLAACLHVFLIDLCVLMPFYPSPVSPLCS